MDVDANRVWGLWGTRPVLWPPRTRGMGVTVERRQEVMGSDGRQGKGVIIVM